MSAPHIPNLDTFRQDPRRARGRGRLEQNRGSNPAGKDRIIQQTDNDAATSRLSAVEAGYLDDPFAKALAHGGTPDRRLPLMNRGTYVRTTAIDRLVDDFLLSHPERSKQVISLGAGSDTRFFRLKKSHPSVSLKYHEFDLAEKAAQKTRQIQTSAFLQDLRASCKIDWQVQASSSTDADQAEGSPSFQVQANRSTYHIHSLDLRTLARPRRSPAQVEQDFSRWGISFSRPTLVISECCLIYLSPDEADAALSYFTKRFHNNQVPIAVIIYEPIRPHDAFGRTMVSNLTARGIHLQTLTAHDTLSAQKERLRSHGFGCTGTPGAVRGRAEAADIDFIWEAWTYEAERARVERLEWMDEVEEWKLLARHYCVAWGWQESVEDAEGSLFSKWAQLPTQDVIE